MYAAITGDIIGSSNLEPQERDLIFAKLHSEFKSINTTFNVVFPLNFVRGDSFQCIINDVSKALKLTLMLKTIFKKLEKDIEDTSSNDTSTLRKNWRIYNNLDIRISVGIGEIEYLKDTIALSDGTALQYSGRNLELMKSKNQKTLITSGTDILNKELEVELKLLDAIMDKWTPLSAETVYYLLQGYKEMDIAKTLSISQSAINQRKKTANWDAISFLLNRFENLMETI